MNWKKSKSNHSTFSKIEHRGKAIIVSAPSGSGKTTIVRALMSRFPKLAFSISATSRDPRGEEKNGEDYYFLELNEFKKRIEADGFVEWEEVYQNQFYGTLESEVDRLWSSGSVVIFDVDVVGGQNLKQKLGAQALSIFVSPPSIEELEKRLRGRGTEDEEKVQMRLKKAAQEMDMAKKFDFTLVNDDLEQAIEEGKKIVSKFIES